MGLNGTKSNLFFRGKVGIKAWNPKPNNQRQNNTQPKAAKAADTEPVTVESRQKWFEEHNPGKRPLWVIENLNTEIIGWVSFQSFYGRPAYDATAEISIYLEAHHRGKGIGKEVLGYCIENAPKFGIKTLLGFIFIHNEPCLGLFRHSGFELTISNKCYH